MHFILLSDHHRLYGGGRSSRGVADVLDVMLIVTDDHPNGLEDSLQW